MREQDQGKDASGSIERVEIPLGGVEAVIFDIDGVLADSLPAHRLAWEVFAERKLGRKLTVDELRAIASGLRNDQLFPILLDRALTPEEINRLADDKERVYREEIYEPEPLRGLPETLKQLKTRGKIKLAVATSAPKVSRDWLLDSLGLTGMFDVVLGEEHAPGKPDPTIYRLAAERLRVRPEACLVFEDSPHGVAAGFGAGMRVIGVLTSHQPEELPGASHFIRDFTQIEFT